MQGYPSVHYAIHRRLGGPALEHVQFRGMTHLYFPAVHQEDGFAETYLRSWEDFHDIVRRLLRDPDYIFRGQQDSRWLLESRLTRLVQGNKKWQRSAAEYLPSFRAALRGRLDDHLLASLSEDELLAIGQHFGMATPLLDWTASPYVALFFAFESPSDARGCPRAVWALHEAFVRAVSKETRKNAVHFVKPASGFNKRLVNQAGLFTKSPMFVDIQSWVQKYFENTDDAILIKVNIPSKGRLDCLRALNRMNINAASLFPDIDGAAHYCNMKIEIPNY